MEFTLVDLVTVISLAIIIGAAVYFNKRINQLEKEKKLIEERRYIEQRPTVASTLGVLGTFLGITIGLIFFKTDDINASIPELLSGLKTAFFTSLAGMVSSMILGKKVNNLYDKYEAEQRDKEYQGQVENMNQAAGMIVKAVNAMVEQSKANSQLIKESLDALNEKNESTNKKLDSVKETLDKTDNYLNTCLHFEFSETYRQVKDDLTEIGTKIDNVGQSVKEQGSSLSPKLDAIDNDVKRVSTTLDIEVEEIETKMGDTNTLLTNKFDEFSDLLKRSNTEALLEVMKGVVEQMQSKMSELIDRLVKENFNELNESVKQLNVWQQENKLMIEALTNQYKGMEQEFANTSTTLNAVGNDTRLLVSDGGKLEQLVGALAKVMVDDQKFQDITVKLAQTVDVTKDSIETFDKASSNLNNWLTKQKNFAEKVDELLVKLQEIEKIKDYGGTFWNDTKQKMEEGVGIIKAGTENLEKQFKAHDTMFYDRLNSTLTDLDACITSFMENDRQ